MMRSKAFPGAILSLITVILLAGCASATNNNAGALKAGPGVDTTAKTITLGLLTPTSGPVSAPVGIPIADGVKTFFQHVNQDLGGIDGYQIKFVEKDTQYDPQQSVVQYNAIHNDVAMIADSLGTATTFALKDLSTQDNMLINAATLSSALAREKLLILSGTPYRLQAENAFDYVVNKVGDKNPKVAIIYQDDDYGQDGLTGYKEAVSAYNLVDGGQVPVAATATSFTAEAAKLKASGAKYVFMTTLPTATATIIGTAHALGYDPQWILQSPAYSKLLLGSPVAPLLDGHVWIVNQGAAWGDTSVPGMKEMLDAIAKYKPDQQPDGYFEYGYTISKVTYAIIKKALDDKDITRAGLVHAYNTVGTIDLGGLYPSLDYGNNPTVRVPSRDSIIYVIDKTALATVRPLSDDFIGTAAKASSF